MQTTESSPLARLILFAIGLSLAGLLAAGSLTLAGSLSHGTVSEVQPVNANGVCSQAKMFACMSITDPVAFEACLQASCNEDPRPPQGPFFQPDPYRGPGMSY